ncbi:toll/interleukin-1 receptor domain-containing protein [Streptomyces sp. NBC_01725]|uniref:toll/interleukin-1 receptor domain-containing protein n=1 Tax=Streptomyces sp. NBC_01725 TaxID=2975923 RepID=UPI002E2AECF4|nr:toll/interleukin-1 receptor domain-containing protein [Streptomyces sp. NBC_01725]
MAEVFINYRTDDGEQTAVALAQGLTTRFGDGRVFRASSSIPPGSLFDDKLLAGVRTSSVLIAVIGKHWAESPRLHHRDDWVRREILEAFRCALPVVPVLVGRGTERLKASALPSALSKLARCHSIRFDSQNAEYDLLRIGDYLAEEVPALEEAERSLKAEQSLEPGSVDNSMKDVSGHNVVQARDVTGGIGGTVIRDSQGPVNSGSGNQHHHAPQLTGDGSSYVAGDQHGGGNRNAFGILPRHRDDER